MEQKQRCDYIYNIIFIVCHLLVFLISLWVYHREISVLLSQYINIHWVRWRQGPALKFLGIRCDLRGKFPYIRLVAFIFYCRLFHRHHMCAAIQLYWHLRYTRPDMLDTRRPWTTPRPGKHNRTVVSLLPMVEIASTSPVSFYPAWHRRIVIGMPMYKCSTSTSSILPVLNRSVRISAIVAIVVPLCIWVRAHIDAPIFSGRLIMVPFIVDVTIVVFTLRDLQ